MMRSHIGRSPNDNGGSAIPGKLVNRDELFIAASSRSSRQRERLRSERGGAISASIRNRD